MKEIKDENLEQVAGGRERGQVWVYSSHIKCPFCYISVTLGGVGTPAYRSYNVSEITTKNCPRCGAEIELLNSSEVRFILRSSGDKAKVRVKEWFRAL